ncbi:MAG: hypothetical protein ABSH41_32305 [Syntrophobacteraceae bacterium]
MKNTGNRHIKDHIYLHDVIMPPPEGYETYHVNGNTLDNRRKNLAFRKIEREVKEKIISRSDEAIRAAHDAFRGKVLWNRHKVWLQRVKDGEIPLPEGQESIMEQVEEEAREIEKKYGKKNLLFDEYELGVLDGMMSALAWVLGSEWDESFDT